MSKYIQIYTSDILQSILVYLLSTDEMLNFPRAGGLRVCQFFLVLIVFMLRFDESN